MYTHAFNNKIIPAVFIGSILIIFGYLEAYGQTIVPPAADPNFEFPPNISPENRTILEQIINQQPHLGNTIENLVMIENASVRVNPDQNRLEATFISEGPISTNGTEGAFGYGVLSVGGFSILGNYSRNASIVTHTHGGILDSEDQSSIDDPVWHNHFVTLGNVEQCGENLGVVDITWQSPGEVRIDNNNATISQIPTDEFEDTDSITNEPLSVTLDQAGRAFSFRLNPLIGEDGLLEAVCITDITPTERGEYIGPRYSIE